VQTYEPPNGVVAVMRRETVEATKGEETVEQQARPVYESCDSHLRTRSDRQPWSGIDYFWEERMFWDTTGEECKQKIGREETDGVCKLWCVRFANWKMEVHWKAILVAVCMKMILPDLARASEK
jgi:hypothetical protein